MRVQRDLSRQVWGRDIKHVALLHLGSFSSHILPDLFALLEREGYRIVTLEEAQSDPIYASDPDVADPRGGTLTELMMQAKGISWPEGLGDKPRENDSSQHLHTNWGQVYFSRKPADRPRSVPCSRK